MRNQNNDDSSVGSWSIPSTVTTAESSALSSSFVHVAGKDVLKLSVTPRNESIGFFSPETTAKIGAKIQACDLENDNDRPSVDMISTLDVSVSMAGNKLKDCKKTLELKLRHLTSRDRFGLVTYGDKAKVEFPACFMTKENKERALQKIRSINVNGSTNLSGGLFMALQEMKMIDKPNQVRSIFLLTDGMANRGITDTDGLVAMVNSFNEARAPAEEMNGMQLDDGDSVDTKPKAIIVNGESPISLFCFGYGQHHNSGMLRAISDASPGGAYYFVEKDSDVASAFGDAMGGLLSVVAQSAVLTISVPSGAAAKGVKILDVHHKDKVQRENGSYTVSIGDFYAEETRDVIFDVRLSGAPSDSPVPHVHVALSYMDTLNKRAASVGPVESVIGRPANADVSPVNMDVEAQCLRVRVIEDIEAADIEARSNNLDAARARIQQSISFINASPVVDSQHHSPIVMALRTDAQDVYNGFRSASTYRSHGTHIATNKGTYLAKQRCMESSASTSNVYRVKKKAAYSKAFKSEK